MTGVDPGWLLIGEHAESEFVARLRGMEPMMDERGQREVLAVAERQVEEARAKADPLVTLRLLLESDPDLLAEYEARQAERGGTSARRAEGAS